MTQNTQAASATTVPDTATEPYVEVLVFNECGQLDAFLSFDRLID